MLAQRKFTPLTKGNVMSECMKADPRYLTSMVTAHGLSVYFSGGDPLIVPKQSSMFNEIVSRINTGNFSNLYELVNLAARIKSHTKGKFTLVEKDGVDVVMLYNQPMPSALSELLLNFVDSGVKTDPIEKFWQNCCKNPSEESRQALYGFIKANNMTLTDDGCFIGYRSVTKDFKDHHTGTFDNSVGTTVKIDRNSVDPDPNNTCSKGLHVAAWNYAWSVFGGSNGVTIEVKVNPKDVVTVPPDYNQQKMRVCEFHVLRQVFSERSELLHPDTFVDQNIDNEDDGMDEAEFYDADYNEDNSVNDSSNEYSLTICSNGGLNIPASMVRAWGLSEGDTVCYCYDEDSDCVRISKNCCGANDDCFSRKVDAHNSIRIGSKVFESWGLDAGEYVLAKYVGDDIEIVVD